MMLNSRVDLRTGAESKVTFFPDFSRYFVLDPNTTQSTDIFLSISEIDDEGLFEDLFPKNMLSDYVSGEEEEAFSRVIEVYDSNMVNFRIDE